MIEYILLGVLSPIILNLMHLCVGVYVVLQRGNIMSLGFTGMGFLTKTMGMLYLESMCHYLHFSGSLLT